METKTPLFKGILLISGTTIGGGMLALPVLTSLAGFVPAVFVYIACWMFMAATGLLLLEVCFWLKKDSNIVSMATHTLGLPGKYAAWVLYLFNFYCLTLAYVVGCGAIVAALFQGVISDWSGSLIFVAIFVPMIYAGPSLVGRINVWLMLGLIISYLSFVILGASHIKPELLFFHDWSYVSFALPIAFVAFAYQGTIPTLVSYMNYDIVQARRAILIGSFIPLVIYIIWEGLILGIVPIYAPGGLAEALQNGNNAVFPLKNFIQNPFVYVIGQFFAFFAMVTSFLGVTLGLLDFLSDGLTIEKSPKGRIFLCALIFVPVLFLAFAYPNVFLMALDLAGGFGCSLLLGLLPILMVWMGRYRLGLKSDYSLGGGKPLLLALIAFVVIELIAQITLLATV